MVHVKTTAVGDRTRFGSHLLSNLLIVSSMDEQRRKGIGNDATKKEKTKRSVTRRASISILLVANISRAYLSHCFRKLCSSEKHVYNILKTCYSCRLPLINFGSIFLKENSSPSLSYFNIKS